MGIAQAALTIPTTTLGSWHADWLWGIPLILLTVTIHAFGLGFLNQRIVQTYGDTSGRRHYAPRFAAVLGTTTFLATTLHAVEAGIWAAAYCLISAMPDVKSAMLYSLNAMTSYGHENLLLAGHWQLLGAMEALNGWLLFGLSTAFLFEVIQKLSITNRTRH